MNREFKFQGRNLKTELETDADFSVFEEVFKDLDYQQCDNIIQNAKNCILDMGAHIGLFSIYCAVLNPGVKIFAFEPDERNFSLLKKNLKLNRINNVYVKNIAVGPEDGVKSFYLSADSHNHSLISRSENQKTVKVQVKTPDTINGKILNREDLSNIDLVKMDIEGSEYDVLASMSDNLIRKTTAFFIELHDCQNRRKTDLPVSLLRKNGFRVSVKKSFYSGELAFLYAAKGKA